MEDRFWYIFTRYLSKESSLEENEELKDIISSVPKYKVIFEQYSPIWNDKTNNQEWRFDKEKIKNRVFENIKSENLSPVNYSIPRWSYAAIILFMICTVYVVYNFITKTDQPIVPITITKSTADNQRAMFTLIDGTEVWLRGNSSITYNEELAIDGVRSVQLTGEAYFNVAKNPDLPFIVVTGEVSTRVLGTKFNVRAFPKNDVEVTVESGEVLVESHYNEVALESNEQATVDLGTSEIVKNRINSKYVTVWKNQVMDMDMVSLKEAFFIMERYYNVTIITDKQADLNCTVRSKYKNENMETVLQGLQLIFDFDFEILEDNKIKITGSGC